MVDGIVRRIACERARLVGDKMLMPLWPRGSLPREATAMAIWLSPLPSTHAVRNTFVEVDRIDNILDSSEPHILTDSVAYAGESDGDALGLQFLDEREELVAGTDVDKIYRAEVHKHMLHLRSKLDHRTVQQRSHSSNARKEQIAANSPDQQSGKGNGIGMQSNVAIRLRARKLAEHRSLWVRGHVNQQQQRQRHAQGDALHHAQCEHGSNDDQSGGK